MKNTFLLVLAVLFVTPVFSQHRLTTREVYDFDPGDYLIHTYSSDFGMSGTYRSMFTRLFLSKEYSISGDTLIYQAIDTTYEFNTNERIWHLRRSDTQTLVYYQLDSFCKGTRLGGGFLPLSLILDTAYLDSNGLVVNECRYPPREYPAPSYSFVHTEGLGETYFYYRCVDNPNCYFYEYLTYYKKAKTGLEGGYKPSFLHIEPNKVHHLKISVYPNPAHNNLSVSGIENGNYQIRDLQGKIVQSGTLEKPLTVNELAEGHYTLYISNPQGMFYGKFIKCN